jgi:hypothetical protein
MAKKVYLTDRLGRLVMRGGVVLEGEIPFETYSKIVEAYPQLESQFEVVEETPVAKKLEKVEKS